MKKNNYLTFLSVLSCIAVLYLHCNFVVWEDVHARFFITSNIIRSIFYFAVPIFFMISGATLLDYKEKYSTKEFFKKRMKKTVIPFLIWSLLGLIFKLLTKSITVSELNISSIINGVLLTQFNDVYWYFPVLFQIYLIIPLFATINKKNKREILKYIAGIMFIFNILIPFIIELFGVNIANPIKIFESNGYLIYVLLGYILHNCELNKKNTIIIYVLGITSLLVMIVGGCYVSIKSGVMNEIFHKYLGVPCLLYSSAVFVFCKQIFEYFKKSKKIENVLSFLSKYTFSTYLIHMYIISVIVNVFNLNVYSIIYRGFAPFLILLISILCTFIIRKIKFLKAILPE